jgi:hypothetical protein
VIGPVMTLRRRGIFVTFLIALLTLGIAVGVVLATSASASPVKGPRDNGGGVQTAIVVTGDLLDSGTPGFTSLGAYWDLPDPNTPNSSYLMTDNGWTINSGGAFTINTEVPLYTSAGPPERPGLHVITVCATRGGASAVVLCQSDDFSVLKGTATLSKTSGRQGSPLTITGKRWVPVNADEAIRITWAPGGANLDVFDDFVGSSWSTTFTVPNLPAGTYKVRICNVSNFTGECAEDAKGNLIDFVDKQFTILDPILTLSQSSGLTGVPFDSSGDIFFPSRSVKIWFGPVGKGPTDPGVHEIGPVGATTNADGHFGKFTYTPTEGPGDYTVTACTISARGGVCNAFDIAQEPYTITAPTPTPTKTPTKSPTPSPTKSPSPTPTASASPSPSPSPSPSLSASPTATVEPTVAPASAPPTASPTPTPEPTPTETPEPTVGPSAPPPPPTPNVNITWPEHLHSPIEVAGPGLDLTTLGTMSLLALLIAFLVPFPGTLFNKTVEANYIEIMSWIAGLKRRWTSLLDLFAIGPLGAGRRLLGRLVTGRLGVLVFLGMSALVYSFLSPTFGFDTNSVALFLGLLVGLAFITAAFDLPLRIYHGRTSQAHDRGVLRALWWTLLVAVICVIVSRLANFQPGYLYGLVVSIVFVTEISLRNEGIGIWLASVWLIILSFIAWVLLAFVRQGAGFDPLLSLFLQTVLVTFVVAGIETLAVGLLPMRFLPGHPLYQWRRGMWFVVFALSVMGYLLILVDPANGYLSDDSRTPMLVGVIFLLTFGIVSLGTWAYFRFRPKRLGIDRPGEAPTG